MSKQTIVTSQDELDAAVASGTKQIIIDSPEGVWLTITAGDFAAVRGKSQIRRVTGSARFDWVDGSAHFGRVDGSAHFGRVTGSAHFDWVDGSAHFDWVDGSAHFGRVTGSAHFGRVDGSAHFGRVTGSAHFDHAAGTPTIHLHGGTLTQAAPHVAVFVHTADSTWSGGTLIDLRELDLTDVALWREFVGADWAVSADNPILVIPHVSSQDHPGRLARDGKITIGCFRGTPVKLREVINGDDWPSDCDAETREAHRPRILEFAAICEQQISVWAASGEAVAS